LPTEDPGAIKLPISVGEQRYSHRFLVMPSLKTPVLIGVDLWAKIGIKWSRLLGVESTRGRKPKRTSWDCPFRPRKNNDWGGSWIKSSKALRSRPTKFNTASVLKPTS